MFSIHLINPIASLLLLLIEKIIFCFRTGGACGCIADAVLVGAVGVPEDPVRAEEGRLESKLIFSLYFCF